MFDLHTYLGATMAHSVKSLVFIHGVSHCWALSLTVAGICCPSDGWWFLLGISGLGFFPHHLASHHALEASKTSQFIIIYITA